MLNRNIIKELVKWKASENRKPLIVRGARQVGKTYIIKQFAEQYFDDYIYINLEKHDHNRLFNKPVSLQEFLDIIKVVFQKKIDPNTLIFIDEIQNSKYLISLLRFFYEERKDLYVAAAGSLLEAIIQKQGLEIPVGRVEFRYLYPLDFFEYLEAVNQLELLEYLKSTEELVPLPMTIHEQALNHFKRYSLIGGMPEVVSCYVQHQDINELDRIYSALMTTYIEDVYKYANEAKTKYLAFIIENAPLMAGSLFTYHNFAGSTYGSREMGEAFDLLNKVFILHSIPATVSKKKPLIAKSKKPSKLVFLDAGLVNYSLDLKDEWMQMINFDNFYQGRIAEQIVGQSLQSLNSVSKSKLFYWAKEKPEGNAEVDFCFLNKGKIVGIEVKAGSGGRLRSLFQFAENIADYFLIRVSTLPLAQEKISMRDKEHKLLSLPFYLLPRIVDFIE